MQTILTIAPIFILILLGWIASRTGFLPEEVLSGINRLVYYFAIPAFLFHAISNFPLDQGFNLPVMLVTLGTACLCYLSGWLLCKTARLPAGRSGALIQGACHGNLGYIGLPVAFYFLGDAGLAQAGIISGFMMILQNVMSVSILQSFASGTATGEKSSVLLKLLQNPVIVTCMVAITVSKLQLPVPEVLDRSCRMLGQLAPPAALLLIGASLTFETIQSRKLAMLCAATVKLVVLPGLGLLFFTLLGVAPADYLPALILLGTPTATIAYVMARQMQSDTDIAVGMVSTTTLLSALTLSLWLSFITP